MITRTNNTLRKGILSLALAFGATSLFAQNVVTLKMKGTSFELRDYTADRYTVTGASLGTARTVKNSKNEDVPIQAFTTTSGAMVTVTALKTVFQLESGEVEEVSFATPQTTLKAIQIKNVGLEKLDLAGATKVTTLLIGNQNPLPELDLTNLASLEALGLDKQYTSVKLPNPSVLKTFVSSGGGAKEIDFSAQKNLEKFTANGWILTKVVLEDMPKLKLVNMMRNSSVASIRIANVPELTELILGGNGELKSLDIENAPKLKYGVVNGNDATGLAVVSQGNGISKIPTIRIVGTALDRFDLGAIGHVDPTSIETLDLSGSPTTSVDLVQLSNLKNLKLNTATTRTIQMSLSQLAKNPSLALVLRELPQLQAGETGTLKLVGVPEEQEALVKQYQAFAQSRGWNIVSTTPVEDVATSELRIFPTQTSDYIYVEGATANASVAVYSLSGALVQRTTTDANGQLSLNLSSLPKASYIIAVGKTKQQIQVR